MSSCFLVLSYVVCEVLVASTSETLQPKCARTLGTEPTFSCQPSACKTEREVVILTDSIQRSLSGLGAGNSVDESFGATTLRRIFENQRSNIVFSVAADTATPMTLIAKSLAFPSDTALVR